MKGILIGLGVVGGLAVAPAACRADLILYSATLNGASEVPPNASTATGFGTVLLNTDTNMITVNLSFTGLTTPATAAHIHGPAPVGVNTGVLFGLTVPSPAVASGSIAPQTFSITPTQIGQLNSGLFYFNVHNQTFPGGEIRGQIGPGQVVPEPSTLAVFGLMGAAAAWRSRRARVRAAA